ncbi:leucine-rich repeat transmembrane protein FLRT2 [Hypanus sabinus]|uniref:leucine-rich repeat transmembrane protein FLRT2 n=1 Tax=Hypanus sabinus TaxID=79690 RepID=UPI0028C3C7C1|nr:leucine-rich repeat transmembrane protein FLRT2 [Hypanus sabinus]XP_059818460.1 leucine-rich repeat transmembrane protein FLRT2 [Hypanus sabinus]XP_059818468.1 leucine-rich repeat transmembrane protein FLRT2 [Hypanus sabinus]XP_059818475.1 leucine-rich repeat transmembrane protein FLRT2 [Hypanus sabinus]XP_059818483.1 leucine-rich repeat transmembrane protein FLRT2 [Hypanus sabinus]XP_059818489.1 leucine-rich repeat transmembrane protein FLRT2 [Hypanus sabinus]
MVRVMGVSQTRVCFKDRSTLLYLWTMFLLGLYTQITWAEFCPSECRCDKKFVYCNDRELTSVPSGIPEGASILYLQNNVINNAGFPLDLRNVLSVQTVYLYGNELDEFPVNLPKNVKELHLQENNIQTVSREALSQLQNLEKLHLDDNSISTVGIEDNAFREATNLKLLFLSRNHLSSVPVGLPLGLEELRLDENRISTVSELAFQNLTLLQRLVLDGNLLANKGIAEGALRQLVQLTELSMVRNSLTRPPANLPGGRLVKLNLQDNQISQIPVTAFRQLKRLERLDLSNNQLRMLAKGAFDGMTSLKQILLRNNPWYCDCNIKWVTKWLQSLSFSINVRGLMCQGPDKVRGMAIRDLNMNLVSCPISTTAPKVIRVSPAPSPSASPTVFSTVLTPAANASIWPFSAGSSPPAPGGDDEFTDSPPVGPLRLAVRFVNDTCIRISWLADFTVTKYRVTWVKLGHSLVGGIVHERVVSGDTKQLSLQNLEPRSTYRICMALLDASNNFYPEDDTVCSEATTKPPSFNTNLPSSPEQATQQELSSPLLLAGLIGGAVLIILVALLGVFCWHMHKKGKYDSHSWKYNRGRRKDDYCEAGTKKDNTILEMTETSFHIVSLNNEHMLKEDFRLQSIYPPNGAISYTDCHTRSNSRFCTSGAPDLEQCHT